MTEGRRLEPRGPPNTDDFRESPMSDSNDTMSAGCAPPGRIEDIRGRRFNRLTVIGYSHRDSRDGRHYWLCRCDCGGEHLVSRHMLFDGTVKSCGCLRRELHFKHGMSETREFRIWKAMIRRCTNPNSDKYHNYGGRGIKVCLEWLDSFVAFYEHVGPCPSPQHSIDRFPDRDGDYCPGNIRWASQKEQMRNTNQNRLITIDGRTQCAVDWDAERGFRIGTVSNRLSYGWDPVDAVLTPLRLPKSTNL